MTYWTNRNEASGTEERVRVHRAENIKRLRTNLDDDDAAVHPIGGIADSAAHAGLRGLRARRAGRDAVGWSIYDFNTTTSGVWARLREDD